MKSELIAMNAERIVSITKEATRNFGIFSCFLLLFLSRRDSRDDSGACSWPDDDLEPISDVDDDFIDLPAEDNAG